MVARPSLAIQALRGLGQTWSLRGTSGRDGLVASVWADQGAIMVTRRRLDPVYLAGISFAVLLQVTAITLLHNAAWKAVSLNMIGH